MQNKQKRKGIPVSNRIKIGKSIRNSMILFLILIVVFAFVGIIQAININTGEIKEKKQIYQYKNKGDIIANINLQKNQYINENEVIEGQVYLSDLISNIDVDFDYSYEGSKDEPITYNYKIEAIVNASYSSTKSTYDVLNKVETLKETSKEKSDSNKLEIKDKMTIDYKKYHEMVKNFKKTMAITVDSNLIIRFTVDTKVDVDGKEVDNSYVVNYKITVGDKVSLIEKENKNAEINKIDAEIKIENPNSIRYDKIAMNGVIIIIALIALRTVICKTEELRVIRNEFKMELNKILKAYEDKIVEIQDLRNVDIQNATKVRDIVQIRKLAEEALVPIYCYVKDEKEAYFIVTKYENSYIYILK